MEVEKIYDPEEIKKAATRLTEIRFDCLVTMYDMGFIKRDRGMLSFQNTTKIPPQWFRLQEKLSLEFIKYEDEYTIGFAIKQAFRKLEDAIKKYENS